jgi:uncharacterized protein (UPF0332 family)
MRELMSWSECKENFIRNVASDPQKIASIVEMAQERLDFVKSLSANEKNASFIFDDYYEIIKELLVALMLKSGMRAKNHQCLISFFAKEHDYPQLVNIIKQMSFLRNRLDYYGERVEYSYFSANQNKFEEIIKLLNELITK